MYWLSHYPSSVADAAVLGDGRSQGLKKQDVNTRVGPKVLRLNKGAHFCYVQGLHICTVPSS